MPSCPLINPLADLFSNTAPSADYACNPHGYLDLLRSAAPRYYHKERKAWIVSGYHDVVRLLRDDRSEGTTSFSDTSPLFRSTVVRKLRSLLSGASLNALQHVVDRIVATQLQQILSKPHADLVTDFTKIIPMAVMAELLGIPQSDWQTLHKLSDSVLDAFDLTWEGQPRPPAIMRSFLQDYFSQHYAAASRGSATPLMTMLLDEQRTHGLAEESMVDACMKLVTAGTSTTAGGLANIMSRLLTQGDFTCVDEDTELRGLADELLRLDTPVLAIKRMARERIQLEDITIDSGERIYLLIASANRDPEVFTSPHHIDVKRESKPHLSFGPGRYHCIGSALAKLEVLGMLKHVVPALKRMQIDKPVSWRSGWLVHEAKKLEVMINE